MKALSIRQPWAWLILHGGKDIENRTWTTRFRGPFYVHAAKGMTRQEYDTARDFAASRGIPIPDYHDIDRGGIVGTAHLVDCHSFNESPWFFGPYGFVLEKVNPLPFHALKGELGFFDVLDF